MQMGCHYSSILVSGKPALTMLWSMDIIKCNGMVSSSSACMFISRSLAHDWNLQDES